MQKGWVCFCMNKKRNLLTENLHHYSCLLYVQCHVRSAQDLLYGILVCQVLVEVMS